MFRVTTEWATTKDDCRYRSIWQLIFMYVIYHYCSLVRLLSSCVSTLVFLLCSSSLYSSSAVFLYYRLVWLMDAHVAFLLTAFWKFDFFGLRPQEYSDFLFRPRRKENLTIAGNAADLHIWVAESWECLWIFVMLISAPSCVYRTVTFPTHKIHPGNAFWLLYLMVHLLRQ